MSISSFSSFALTRSEMKNVRGGSNQCAVCSTGKKGGTCGPPTMGNGYARELARELNKRKDGYTYRYECL
jgi:hypothetical protein